MIAILAAISVVAYNGIQARAHSTAAQSDLANNAKKLEEYRILNGEYPDTRTKFRAAGLKFTLGSYRHLLYCVRNTGANPNWALVGRSVAGEQFYRTAQESWQPYAGGWSTWSAVCDAVGLTSPDASTWLAANDVWNDWVVY